MRPLSSLLERNRRDIMTRGLGILGAAFVVALALAPRSADAQQISACVNNSSGTVKFVAPNATCSNNETLVKLGGALAGADYQCVAGGQIIAGDPLQFSAPTVSFGSAIGTAGTPPITSFTLQQGIYQIHLSGSKFSIIPSANGNQISANLDGTNVANWTLLFTTDGFQVRGDIVGGDRLVSVGGANTTLKMINAQAVFTEGFCELVITKLQ
jgi:hypothetical protein